LKLGDEKSPLEPVTKLLSNLNPRRAFALFFCALSVGAILIFGGWWKPFSPAVPVLAYGAILVAAQERYFVQLGPNLKDSPYFLGFILTLFEILNVVMIGFPQQNSDAFMFREIGAAILTTAVGLFMRQILLASDQAEEAQDRIFRTIAEEVRKDTVEFHDTQKVFVALVKEFVQAREGMFSDEEKAFAEYLKALKDGALRLGALPKRVETVLSALEKSGTRIGEISSGLENGLSVTAERFRRDVDSLTGSFVGSRRQLGDEILSLAQAISDVAKQTEAVHATIGQSASVAEQTAKIFGDSVSGFSSKVDDARGGIDSLIKDLGRVATDLRGVDQITDDLIRILRERLAVLNDAFQRERPI
jgi:hypothetical protein